MHIPNVLMTEVNHLHNEIILQISFDDDDNNGCNGSNGNNEQFQRTSILQLFIYCVLTQKHVWCVASVDWNSNGLTSICHRESHSNVCNEEFASFFVVVRCLSKILIATNPYEDKHIPPQTTGLAGIWIWRTLSSFLVKFVLFNYLKCFI